jgi:hypothetical protein
MASSFNKIPLHDYGFEDNNNSKDASETIKCYPVSYNVAKIMGTPKCIANSQIEDSLREKVTKDYGLTPSIISQYGYGSVITAAGISYIFNQIYSHKINSPVMIISLGCGPNKEYCFMSRLRPRKNLKMFCIDLGPENGFNKGTIDEDYVFKDIPFFKMDVIQWLNENRELIMNHAKEGSVLFHIAWPSGGPNPLDGGWESMFQKTIQSFYHSVKKGEATFWTLFSGYGDASTACYQWAKHVYKNSIPIDSIRIRPAVYDRVILSLMTDENANYIFDPEDTREPLYSYDPINLIDQVTNEQANAAIHNTNAEDCSIQ